MERIFLAPPLSFNFTFFLRAEVGQNLQSGTPTLELHLPVYNNGRRHYDQMWTPYTTVTCQ